LKAAGIFGLAALLGGREGYSSDPSSEQMKLLDSLGAIFGESIDLVNGEVFLSRLKKADFVCLGESHFKTEDMLTIDEIIRTFAAENLVVGLERFSWPLQAQLDEIYAEKDKSRKQKLLEEVFANKEYQEVWGEKSEKYLGVTLDKNIRDIFERMVRRIVERGIQIVALDVSLAQRRDGWENVLLRSKFWSELVGKFLTGRQEKVKMVIVGGIWHMTNDHFGFPALLRDSRLENKSDIVSVGQRNMAVDDVYWRNLTKIADGANLNELIVKAPRRVNSAMAMTTLKSPPDYWIAYHKVGSWAKW